jgi:peptide deformylase
MAVRNIVLDGDEILRKRCKEVKEIDDRIRMILDDMTETMRSREGVGIAAPQVGVMRRMFVVEPEEGVLLELINPRLIESSGIQTGEEGCLSVPGYVGTVERPEYIKVEALDRYGKIVVHEGTDILAVALSHELDHLEGILYTDKASEVHEATADTEEE